eukprot:67799-Prymnesium_polylepis.1
MAFGRLQGSLLATERVRFRDHGSLPCAYWFIYHHRVHLGSINATNGSTLGVHKAAYGYRGALANMLPPHDYYGAMQSAKGRTHGWHRER